MVKTKNHCNVFVILNSLMYLVSPTFSCVLAGIKMSHVTLIKIKGEKKTTERRNREWFSVPGCLPVKVEFVLGWVCF